MLAFGLVLRLLLLALAPGRIRVDPGLTVANRIAPAQSSATVTPTPKVRPVFMSPPSSMMAMTCYDRTTAQPRSRALLFRRNVTGTAMFLGEMKNQCTSPTRL